MKPEDLTSEHRRTSSQVWLMLGLIGIAGLFVLLQPFLISLAMAAVIAVLMYPVHQWCTERAGHEGGIAVFGAAGVFLGPVLFVVSVTLIEMTRVALDEEATPGALLLGAKHEAE